MKKRNLLLIFLVTLLFLSFKTKVNAQSHSCVWDGPCREETSCPGGWTPEDPCSSFDDITCEGSHPCVQLPTPTPDSGDDDGTGGTCRGDGDIFTCHVYIENCDMGFHPEASFVIFEGCLCNCVATEANVAGGVFCNDETSETSINTALGCLPTQGDLIFAWIIARALAIGGGVALMLMVFAGLQIITAGGNPQRVQEGQGLLTAAITGLLVIAFAIFLLKIIGYDILGIF